MMTSEQPVNEQVISKVLLIRSYFIYNILSRIIQYDIQYNIQYNKQYNIILYAIQFIQAECQVITMYTRNQSSNCR